MTDLSPEARLAAARELEANRLLGVLFDELEKASVNAVVGAKYDDHEARQAAAAEIRAIRILRARIAAEAKAGQARPIRKAPA